MRFQSSSIKDINAYEILDSRGNPTVGVTVTLRSGIQAHAGVPSGASTGIHEALELRDHDKKRFSGNGVLKAVKNVNKIIAPELIGILVTKQSKIDEKMRALDGTENKSRLGANAILGVSLACARAAALHKKIPLYRYIAQLIDSEPRVYRLPVTSFNIINGGKHADNGLDFQEYMIFPSGISKLHKRVQAGSEIFHCLKKILHTRGLATSVGDEGGFAPLLGSNKSALDLLTEAVQSTLWRLGKDIFFALDPAASEFYKKKRYILNGENPSVTRTTEEMIDYWAQLTASYPIFSIEDPLAQDDWDGWKAITSRLGKKIQIVGDDFLVTNPNRISKAIECKSANAVLIKVNQIGTLMESLEAIHLAKKAGWRVMVSHRSGETTDDFIADLSVGAGADQIKSGSLSRGERLVKYNRLMAIERELER